MIILDKNLTIVITNDISIDLNIINIKKLKNYTCLLRTTALVMQFNKNLKKKKKKKKKAKEDLKLSALDSTEIDSALKIWIHYAQQTVTNTKNCKQLQRDLNLHNVDGIIRCYGRLENAPFTSDMKHTIFLPRTSGFTDLVICYQHSLVMHNGVKETLNQPSNMFWV